MRSIWKGSISFGLVSIPIKVVGATESHSVSFRQIHTADGGRIRYRKVCELDEQEVSGEEISKGYVTLDGTLVEVSDEDLAAMPLPTAKTVELLGFTPVEEIDPIQLDRSYYLAADSGGDKPYVLLREALRRSGKAAVAKLAMRGRETLGLLRVLDEVIVLHTMLWPDEIRSSAGVAPEGRVNVRDAELDLADTLMDTLGEVDLEELHDEYRAAVEELVTAKLSGAEPPKPGEERPPGRVLDLMSALESSVQAARSGRGEDAGEGNEATVTDLQREQRGDGRKTEQRASGGGTSKRSTGRRSTGKQSTSKQGAGKKTASEKSTSKRTGGEGAAKKTAKSRSKKRAS